MATILEEELKELDADTEWLHSNYNELINKYNEQFFAIRNRDIIVHDKDSDELIEKLREKGFQPGEVLTEYIRDKRNQ
jgi:hypothetical protein